MESLKRSNIELSSENAQLERKVDSMVKTLRHDQVAKLADYEELEKYRLGQD